MPSGIIKIMQDVAIKASRHLKRDYGEIENLQISKKGPGNFVTSADLKAEKIIIEELQRYYPDHGFISEEAGVIKGKNEFTFIIDPIDGTTNFMHGLPIFCISIALVEKTAKDPIKAGVIYAPILDDLYWAELNEGAYLNDKKLYVSARDNIDESLFATYLCRHNDDMRKNEVEFLKRNNIQTRIYGSAALELAFVAAGKLDGMWHSGLKPWDVAAGILMVKEARGMVSEIDGGTNYLQSGNIVASNSEIFSKLRKKLKECYTDL